MNLSFRAASKARAKYKASSALAWNVHSHPAGGMIEHQKGTSAEGEIAFEAPSEGVFSFMWKNEGQSPVTLEVSLSGDGGVAEVKR